MKTLTNSSKWWKMTLLGAIAVLAMGAAAVPSIAFAGSDRHPAATRDADRPASVKDAEAAVEAFRKTDPSLKRFLDGAVGYAVFPSVGKGAIGVGGAYGSGVVFERSNPVGRTTLTQLTVGPQLGGQAYSEIVFFENEKALSAFKKGQLAMAAQVSAVVASSGASANARYDSGVAIFTQVKGGLMAEASVGGQRFGYRPFSKAM